jgi:hypothetical protein
VPQQPKKELTAGIKRLAMLGLSNIEIASELKVTKWSVIYHIHKLMAAKEIPSAKARRGNPLLPEHSVHLRTLRARYGVSWGSMQAMLAGLTKEQREWLFQSTPRRSTVGDIIRSIIVDAYEEESDAS